MLVLSRKKNESILINDNIRIEILQIKGKQIRLGISAPEHMRVLRGELPDRNKKCQTQKRQSKRRVLECDLHTLVGAVMASA
jgi:carbon storage regulator CsrA